MPPTAKVVLAGEGAAKGLADMLSAENVHVVGVQVGRSYFVSCFTVEVDPSYPLKSLYQTRIRNPSQQRGQFDFSLRVISAQSFASYSLL